MNFDEVAALKKAFNSVKERQKNNPLYDFEKKKKRLKEARELCIGNEKLLEKAVKKLEGNGFKVIRAKNKQDAIKSILDEIGNEKLIVKSKSNVTKEIDLTHELEKHGIEVIETDIGDRILQVLKLKPSHPTGPIAHMSAKKIAEGLSSYYKKNISDNPEEIVKFIRDEIRAYIEKAKVGITGANAITVEEGSIVITHNEGNIYESIRRDKHIVVTGIDKIYPSVEDALNMLKIICFNATGSTIPSFVEIISGVSKTADVEKKFFRGVHTPKDMTVILLDNKRSEIMKGEHKELLYCIDCGNCLIHCPMYNTVGNFFADEKYLGGKGLALQSLTADEVNKKLEYCLSCGKCRENCPLEINVPVAIRKIRSDSVPEEVWYFLKSHVLWLYWALRLRLS
ncbi:MAG: LUD domain-containing protein [Thermodesulfovibrionales bacterium]|nr:LUD domain-containing protein [Thermodesulfovibrionales bacterium]